MESRAFHVKHSCGQTMKVENEVIRRYDYWKIRVMGKYGAVDMN